MEESQLPESTENEDAHPVPKADRGKRTARGCGIRLLVALVLLVVCVALIKDLNIGYTFRNTAFIAENRPVVDAILASVKAAYPKFEIDGDSLESMAIPQLSKIMEESYGSSDICRVSYEAHARLFTKDQRKVFIGFQCAGQKYGHCVQVSVYFRIKDEGIEIVSAHTGKHEWAARSWQPDPPYLLPKPSIHETHSE